MQYTKNDEIVLNATEMNMGLFSVMIISAKTYAHLKF